MRYGCSLGNDKRKSVVIKKFVGGGGGWLRRGKGKSGLVEDNTARDDDTITGEIHAAITLVVRRVAEKNTSTRPGSEFVGHGGSGVGVAKATKDPQGRVIGVGVM